MITEKLNVTQRAGRFIIYFYFTLCFDTGYCHVTQAVLVPNMYPRQASNCDNPPVSASSMLELQPRNTILGLCLCVCMFTLMYVRVCVHAYVDKHGCVHGGLRTEQYTSKMELYALVTCLTYYVAAGRQTLVFMTI